MACISVRHWYCRNPACSRKIFAGSLAPLASSHQQSSQSLQNLQRQMGLIAGGEAGKRAATTVGLRCSADTLLRRLIIPWRRNCQARPMSVLMSGVASGPLLRYVNSQS